LSNGSVRWRVWAPRARNVNLVTLAGDGRRTPHAMHAEEHGHFALTLPDIPGAQRYVYQLDGGDDRPDPCSLWQPDGVPGPSAVFRPGGFSWTDQHWKGVPRADLVFYELHVGTFTPEGTFDAIIPRLESLKDLGVTALELMPVSQFPGRRNWGYDGVLPYATQNSYGGPESLQRLIEAAHKVGLAVVLDVVYNHLGPEGNYLSDFGPYFTDKYKTPWGSAVNYDDKGSDAVRDFVLDNVRMWLAEFHLDGLRLDAVHAIYDLGARHLLRAIKDVADDVAQKTGRTIEIVGESDQNDPRICNPPERGGHGLDAQWSDDFHHAVHAYLTGERRGYYAEYGEARQIAKALETPFLFAADYSPHRGRKHGAPPVGLTGDRFVVCIQNHDQVGNRAKGDRLTTMLGSHAKHRLAASLMLLSPHLPLLFMGEEYAEENPFPFFCSFCDEQLIEAVRQGRKREFADFVSTPDEVPDPHGEQTFASARLTWSWPEGTPHAAIRRLYKDLLTARKNWPALRDFTTRTARLLSGEGHPAVIEFTRGSGADAIRAYFNLTPETQPLPTPRATESILFASEYTHYCGGRRREDPTDTVRPFECIVLGPPNSWKPD
jgi:maltooligosyltrehalose trehalohydrolase